MSTEKKKPEITQEQAFELGISAAEWRTILSLLGRGPTEHEAWVFKVIWSEEVAEIHSRNVSRFFHQDEEKYRKIPGARAAVVPIDEETSLVMSCHAHLGGVQTHARLGIQADLENALADLWELGAEPLASSVLLRLGQASNIEHIKLFQSLVGGSSSYLMHSGLPLADLDYFFHSRFKHQPVVNTFALGVVETRQLTSTFSSDKEYILLYVGAHTEPFERRVKKASANLPDSSAYASLVLGDPIWGARLAGGIVDAINSRKVLAVQKIAKGGFISALFALAQRTDQAFELQLDRVPLSFADIPPREIMLSESPGRMLLIATKEDYKDLHEVFDKWKLKVTVIGNITGEYGIKVNWRHNELVDIPIKRVLAATPYSEYQLLTHPPMLKQDPRHTVEQAKIEQVGELGGSDFPVDDEEGEDPELQEELAHEGSLDVPVYLNDTWMDLLGNPAFADRTRLHRLYDRAVASRLFPGFRDSSILRIGSGQGEKLIAATVVSKPLLVYNDTYLGAAHTVAEAIRNLSCVGATPLAAAACFNLGNPRKYKDLCDMSEIMRGAGDACRFWNVPVACEDVDLTLVRTTQGVMPTMCIELVGLVDNRDDLLTSSFKNLGDVILVLGDTKREIEATEYSYYCHQRAHGTIPDLNYEHEATINGLVRDLVHRKLLKSAHAVGAGGIAIALGESCLTPYPPLGAELSLDTKMSAKEFRSDALLFSETAGRFLVSCSPEDAAEVRRLCKERGVFIGGAGSVGGRNISIVSPIECSIFLPTAYKVWTQGINSLFGEE